MNIREVKPEGKVLEALMAMSAAWESEKSCHGYSANGRAVFEKMRVLMAEEEQPVGYLLAYRDEPKRSVSVMPEKEPYLEIEEIYVMPQYRGYGVGRALFEAAEDMARAEGLQYVMLSTATKDWRKILHFYIEELGMEFWNARLFKRLQKVEKNPPEIRKNA